MSSSRAWMISLASPPSNPRWRERAHASGTVFAEDFLPCSSDSEHEPRSLLEFASSPHHVLFGEHVEDECLESSPRDDPPESGWNRYRSVEELSGIVSMYSASSFTACFSSSEHHRVDEVGVHGLDGDGEHPHVSSILSLPDECVAIILSFSRATEILSDLCFVCRRFNFITSLSPFFAEFWKEEYYRVFALSDKEAPTIEEDARQIVEDGDVDDISSDSDSASSSSEVSSSISDSSSMSSIPSSSSLRATEHVNIEDLLRVLRSRFSAGTMSCLTWKRAFIRRARSELYHEQLNAYCVQFSRKFESSTIRINPTVKGMHHDAAVRHCVHERWLLYLISEKITSLSEKIKLQDDHVHELVHEDMQGKCFYPLRIHWISIRPRLDRQIAEFLIPSNVSPCMVLFRCIYRDGDDEDCFLQIQADVMSVPDSSRQEKLLLQSLIPPRRSLRDSVRSQRIDEDDRSVGSYDQFNSSMPDLSSFLDLVHHAVASTPSDGYLHRRLQLVDWGTYRRSGSEVVQGRSLCNRHHLEIVSRALSYRGTLASLYYQLLACINCPLFLTKAFRDDEYLSAHFHER